MPNGIDKNIVRLSVTVGVYRARFKQWPTHARFEPIVLWDFAQILDSESFARLASLMELRTQKGGISVGGVPGTQQYDDVEWELVPAGAQDEARRWLGVEPRPDLRH
jgi:hypothetical protein